MKKKIKLLVVECQLLMRQGLLSQIAGNQKTAFAGEAADADEILAVLEKVGADVVVIGRTINYCEAFDLAARIAKDHRQVRVLALPPEAYLDRHYVTTMLTAGAWGIIDRRLGFEELARGVRRVVRGKTFLSEEAAEALAQNHRPDRLRNGRHRGEEPTSREREVVKLIAEAASAEQIAVQLRIAPKTVTTHRTRAMKKLGFTNSIQLVRWALRTGLASLDE